MSKTPVSTLQEYAAKNMWGVPDYVLISSSGSQPPKFTYKVTACSTSACGTATSKKDAKHAAAKALLVLLNSKLVPVANTVAVTQSTKEVRQKIGSYYLSPELPDADIFVNSIGKLSEYCIQNRLKPPEYRDAGIHGPQHERVYTTVCCIGDVEIRASGKTKKKAKHIAAQEMLDKLVRNGITRVRNETMMNDEYKATETLPWELEFLDLKIEEPSISARESASRANGLYTKLQTYRGIKKNFEKITMSHCHLIFKEKYEPLVREIALESVRLNSHPKISKQEILKNVTSLLGLKVEYDVLSSTPEHVIIICKLNSSPVIVDMGMADTYLDARDQAISNALQSINILLT